MRIRKKLDQVYEEVTENNDEEDKEIKEMREEAWRC